MTKKILFIFSFAVSTLLWSVPSGAYVLPGPQLLELMTREMGKADTLAISQRLVLVNDRESAPGGSFREMLSYRYPRSFRLESHSENNHRIFLVVDSETIVIAGNQRVPEREDIWDQYTDILFYRSGELLAEKLRLTGIDVMVTSLGRFEGKPCYVLGAQYPDLTSPQIWIEKDTFLPFRWLVPESSTGKRGQLLEFRFLDWRKKGKAWYPMHIQIMEGKSPGREIYVEGLEVNPTLDGSLFDIGSLKKRYPVSTPMRSNPVAPEPRSDIQKTIEDFKKRYK
ncbi:MAG: hypothetical protein V2B19_02495 [Pseudomonadota bacterium]